MSAVVDIELDVFSGRPNPRWQLAPELAARVEALVVGIGEPDALGLGYRGFLVEVGGRTVRVYGNADELEQLLRASALDHGFGALLDGV